ncbi:MAG: hypothetical protein DMF63_07225 [Acidobacteria bacterium]|nr:MAG: hypothetical protein DMF63_07225 [Acidobacteriota bacterium]
MQPTFTDDPTVKREFFAFDEIAGGPLSVRKVSERAPETLENKPATDRLQDLLSAIKWIFLFVPGAVAINFSVMTLSLSMITGVWQDGSLAQWPGAMVAFTFMVLFGIGRLTDMRYLKVVGAILSSSILCTILFHILASFFIGYSGLGWGMLAMCVTTVSFAQIIKNRIDREESV